MVRLTLKNLQQQTFHIDIDMTASVRELKEKIEKDRGKDYPAIGQKLIYAGKILQDDSKLESYSMDINKFLVIMVTKPKSSSPVPEEDARESSATGGTEASASTESQATTSTTEGTTSTTSSSTTDTTTTTTSASDTTTTTASSDASAASAPQPAADAAASAESLLVMGEDYNRMVENIMEMGYDRREVERALRASFNNPHIAVQYLVDGIPENTADAPAVGGALEEAAEEAAGAVPMEESGGGESGGGGGGGNEEDPLAFLRNQPQFVQMTQMMRSNPQLLDAFLQQIRTTNPGLLQAIQENQEAFVRMINQPQTGSASGGGGGGGGGGGSGGNTGSSGGNRGGAVEAAAPGGGGGNQDGRSTILLTAQDREAIDRLLGLGNFPEDLVVQAYFACERNENLAAEFLFSQPWD